MGKNNKKGNKANVFKVAGAKSLKKTKTKAVNLGLKNIKQTVVDIDKQFVEINKKPTISKKPTAPVPKVQKKKPENLSKEDVAKTVEKIVKMDL